VQELTRFIASIPRPTEKPPHGYTLDDVLKGERLFGSVGCSACHVADLRPVSGMFSDLLLHDMGARLQSPFPAPLGTAKTTRVITATTFAARGPSVSSSQQYYGSGGSISRLPQPYPLADPEQPRFPRGKVPESDTLSWDALQREWRTPPLWGVADTAPYLHDGRAETLEDAILWHGGEAESSRVGYSDLSRPERDLVLAFLSSLRAPKAAATQDE
jgi:cytochrome c peroxidase